jgi:hypothetical protein
LEHYRFKGDDLYPLVKKDLQSNSKIYFQILKLIGEKEAVIHLSNDYGQLDLLLALDAIDRVLHTYISKPYARAVLKNNFLTRQYSKIRVYETKEETILQDASTLFIDTDVMAHSFIMNSTKEGIDTIILLKSGQNLKLIDLLSLDFHLSFQNDNFIVLNKKNH